MHETGPQFINQQIIELCDWLHALARTPDSQVNPSPRLSGSATCEIDLGQ